MLIPGVTQMNPSRPFLTHLFSLEKAFLHLTRKMAAHSPKLHSFSCLNQKIRFLLCSPIKNLRDFDCLVSHAHRKSEDWSSGLQSFSVLSWSWDCNTVSQPSEELCNKRGRPGSRGKSGCERLHDQRLPLLPGIQGPVLTARKAMDLSICRLLRSDRISDCKAAFCLLMKRE